MPTAILGQQRPRLETIPTYSNSLGQETIQLAASCGLGLDDWQRYSTNRFMGTNPVSTYSAGVIQKWSAFEILLIVSRQNGKGSILEARELAGLFIIPSDRLIMHTAHEHKTASEHFRRIRTLIRNNPELDKQVIHESGAYGREFIEIKAGPTIIIGSEGKLVRVKESHRLVFIARTGGSGRGFTGDLVVYDECMILDANKVSASIPSTLARPNPQIWYTGSAGEKTSTQMASVRRAAFPSEFGSGLNDPDDSVCAMEWSIVPHNEYCQPGCTEHDDRESEEAIAKANPGYNIRLFPDTVAKVAKSFRDDPIGYDREILGVGQYPAPDNAWLVIPEKKWNVTTDHTLPQPRFKRPVFAIDMTPKRTHSAIAVAGARPDEFVGIEVVKFLAGNNWLIDEIVDINFRHNNPIWIVDKRAAGGSFIDELERRKIKVEVISATDIGHACGQFFDITMAEELRHPPQRPLSDALAGADMRILGERWAWDRDNSGTNICPLVAVTYALWGYLKFEVDQDYKIEDTIHWNTNQVIRLVKAGVYDYYDLQRLRSNGLLPDSAIKELREAGIEVTL